jgi:hypothetical protein
VARWPHSASPLQKFLRLISINAPVAKSRKAEGDRGPLSAELGSYFSSDRRCKSNFEVSRSRRGKLVRDVGKFEAKVFSGYPGMRPQVIVLGETSGFGPPSFGGRSAAGLFLLWLRRVERVELNWFLSNWVELELRRVPR